MSPKLFFVTICTKFVFCFLLSVIPLKSVKGLEEMPILAQGGNKIQILEQGV